MEDEKILADTNETTAPAAEDTREETANASETEQTAENPLKAELEKVNGKRSKLEQLLYTKKRVEKQLAEITGTREDSTTQGDDDDNRPLTVAEFKKLQAHESTKTALDLADEIDDEYERELVKHYVSTGIRTGNARQDLEIARAFVNSKKNAMVAEEAYRSKTAKPYSKGNSAPAKTEEAPIELTADEQMFLRAKKADGTPLMTLDDIRKARKTR